MVFSLQTKRLILGILDETYAENVDAFFQRNMTYLQPWIAKKPNSYYSLEKQTIRLYLQAKDFREQKSARFYLFKKSNSQKIIGNIGLTNIIRGAFWSCHLGYQIEEQEQGKGLMTEALREIVRYAFEDLQLHRIEANVMPRNIASIRVVKKVGFENEGLAKKYLKINKIWEDHYRFVLLNEVVE